MLMDVLKTESGFNSQNISWPNWTGPWLKVLMLKNGGMINQTCNLCFVIGFDIDSYQLCHCYS